MSDTPRTDEEAWPEIGNTYLVEADFARQLERELTAAREISQKYEDRYFAANGSNADLSQVAASLLARAEAAEKQRDQWREVAGELADVVRSDADSGFILEADEALAAYDALLAQESRQPDKAGVSEKQDNATT